jgi:hypothetical protein
VPSSGFLDWTVKVSQPISTIILAIVSAFGFHTFFDSQQGRREQFTMQLVSQYSSEPLLSHRLVLIGAIRSAQALDRGIGQGGEVLSGYFLARNPEPKLMQEIESSLIAIDVFYVSLAACANDARICDRDLMVRLLNREPTGFHCVFGELSSLMSKEYNLPNLGSGLRELSGIMEVNCGE